MVWPRGRRRNTVDASRFIRTVGREFTYKYIARLLNVSDRTVRRWASGEDYCSEENCILLVNKMFKKERGSLPLYSLDMAIDGNTRVGGVGEFTKRAAQNDRVYLKEIFQ